MRHHTWRPWKPSTVGAAILVAACSVNTMTTTLPGDAPEPTTATPSAPATEAAPAAEPEPRAYPLLAEWTGPYGGVPAFDRMEIAAPFSRAYQSAPVARLG